MQQPLYNCFGFFAVVGPDDERTPFANHAYQNLGGSRNYDACLPARVDPALPEVPAPLPPAADLHLLVRHHNDKRLLNRADGWLVDLSHPEYNSRINEPFEASASGGTPALQTLQFSITYRVARHPGHRVRK